MSNILVGSFTVSTQASQILLPNHGLILNDRINFVLGAAGNTLPSPVVIGVDYFVVTPRGNDFQVALTSSGTPITLASKGTGSNQVWKVTAPPTGTGGPIWTYKMVYSTGNEPDLTQVNIEAQNGWACIQVNSRRGSSPAQWAYLLQKQIL